jgi:hypothetical protein
MFTREHTQRLESRLLEPRRFIQIVLGPRQVGKTTLVRQVLADLGDKAIYASADGPPLAGSVWIETQWDRARRLAAENGSAVLALDEVQKVERWSEAVKQLWDEDSAAGTNLHVVLLGSAPLLMQRGLTESLAGRFETIPVSHWSFAEMEAAFGWTVDQYLYFGGYPGAAPLIDEPQRWADYVRDSLIETTVARDILQMTRVDKPALLRRVFELGCAYSGQILSYQKMQGQLQDAGNTTTLAHYLDLLSAAGMLGKLEKYAGEKVRTRASSPKLQVLNTALMSVSSGRSFEEARNDSVFWGRLVESCVGAHLLNSAYPSGAEVTYWRSRNREVDFIVERGRRRVAIEVGSAKGKGALPGIEAFKKEFGETKTLLVGRQGVPLEEFLRMSPADWLD